MSLKQNLIAAKSLIDTPEKWYKMGGEHDGLCILQACNRVTGNEAGQLMAVIRAELHVHDNLGVYDFNDASSTTHADVMALFDRAIEAAP